MELQSFYQVCIFFTIGLMVFTMSMNVINSFDVFGNIEPTGGVMTGNTTNSTFLSFSKQTFNSDLWVLILAGGLLTSVPIMVLTQSVSIGGVYLFAVYFWGSFFTALNILYIGGFLPLILIPLFVVPIIFLFIGAIIGMLAGV